MTEKQASAQRSPFRLIPLPEAICSKIQEVGYPSPSAQQVRDECKDNIRASDSSPVESLL